MSATGDMRTIIAKRRDAVRKKKAGEAVVIPVNVVVIIASEKMQGKKTRTGGRTEVQSSTKKGPSIERSGWTKAKIKAFTSMCVGEECQQKLKFNFFSPFCIKMHLQICLLVFTSALFH